MITTSAAIIEDLKSPLLNMAIAASTKGFNRYNIRPGRIFGKPQGKERYKVVDINGNTIYYKDLTAQKVFSDNIDSLAERWTRLGIVEISQVNEILEIIKKALTPYLGGFLVAGLVSWLWEKLR